jgi:hypothetical protein
MSGDGSMTDRAWVFGYKVQRKLRREVRKRFTPALVKWDRHCFRAATPEPDARGLLLDYTGLVSGIWPDDVSKWLSKEEADAVVMKADEARAHRFDLLGSGVVDLGDSIDWHCDLKTGFRWPDNVHHLNIAWDAVPSGTDIKMPWELSRCQHFATLALADMVTLDAGYYEEFKSQVRCWIRSNPCGFGVNWVCAMDVAIRAVNWLTAAALFRRRISADGDVDFFQEFVESLWLHARHIMRNLEWQGPRSTSLANHFLADLCGVLAVGCLFRKCRQGRSWLSFSQHWFETEVRRQVFADGANFETSTSYHRLSHEMFLWADMMVDRLGVSFSSAYRDRLIGMASFVSAYTSPSGRAAQFGDNDGGRLMTVGIGDFLDHRYLASSACGSGGRANRLLLSGERKLPEMVMRKAFPEAGYWFGSVSDGWLGVRAGEISHGGAHAHADQLSFVLTVAGHDVIVDPGTGVYSADVDKRNAYRATSAHNAPQLNEMEANRFPEGMAGLFRMSDDTKTEVMAWEATSERVFFEGCHYGYCVVREGSVCRRSMLLEKGRLVVVDHISCLQKGDRVGWSLRFAPGIELEAVAGGAVITFGNRNMRISTNPAMECMVGDVPFSPSYGVEVPARCLYLRRTFQGDSDEELRIEMHWDDK